MATDIIDKLTDYFNLKEFEKVTPLKRLAEKSGMDVPKFILIVTGGLMLLIIFNYGSNLIASLIGFAYPAYMSFKAIDTNKQDISQMREWLTYWVVYSFIVVLDPILCVLFFWLNPFFSFVKIAGYISLFHPRTRYAVYIYDTFLKDFLKKHEEKIDEQLNKIKEKIDSGSKKTSTPNLPTQTSAKAD